MLSTMATDKLHMSNQTSAKATLCLAHLAGIRPEETKQYKLLATFSVMFFCGVCVKNMISLNVLTLHNQSLKCDSKQNE